MKFTIGEETHRRLRRVQTLLRREIPDGDPGAIFDRALAVLLEKVEKQKLGATSKPRVGRSIRPRTDKPAAQASRHIPNEVKRAVSRRDGDRCGFVAPTGRRCEQRSFLEFHHVQPFARQGPATVDNIALRCRRHNRYEAEQEFGPFDPSIVRETSPAYGESQPGLERVRSVKPLLTRIYRPARPGSPPCKPASAEPHQCWVVTDSGREPEKRIPAI